MAKIQTTRGRQLQPVSTKKSQLPLDQLIAVTGQNPLAKGIDVLGEVIQKRAELRRQGEQLARLEQAYGLEEGELADLDPTMATTVGKTVQERRMPTVIEQINPDGTSRQIEIPAGKKFGGTVRVPGQGGGSGSPKGGQLKGVTADGRPVRFNPNTLEVTTPDGKPYTGQIFPTTVGTEEQRRQSLVQGAQHSIADIKRGLTPGVLTELKAIRLTPGRIYGQLASSEAKRLYINLREAISNEVYLKTGATANEQELENATVSYLAALNDNPQDFLMRMDLLERNITPFAVRKNQLTPISEPASLNDPLGIR